VLKAIETIRKQHRGGKEERRSLGGYWHTSHDRRSMRKGNRGTKPTIALEGKKRD